MLIIFFKINLGCTTLTIQSFPLSFQSIANKVLNFDSIYSNLKILHYMQTVHTNKIMANGNILCRPKEHLFIRVMQSSQPFFLRKWKHKKTRTTKSLMISKVLVALNPPVNLVMNIKGCQKKKKKKWNWAICLMSLS